MPLTSAFGSITETVARPPPTPLASAVASILDRVDTVTAPLMFRIVPLAPPAAIEVGAPMKASTRPGVNASALTTDALTVPSETTKASA